jgi:molecular chaperone DnaK
MSIANAEPGQIPVGIDLGTTFSVVAYLDDAGRPTTIFNSDGEYLTPSALFFDEDNIVVGKEAVKSSPLAPDCYVECFKRDMGSVSTRKKIRGQEVPPEILSAFILERLKLDAERKLGSVRQVVVTVPAFFDETRRRATQEAGALAGLEVMDIINEPTAAALAFGYQHGIGLAGKTSQTPMRVLVYDLGGGTFDVTILEIAGTQFRTLATDGDVWLGGKDFDERLVNYCAEQFQAAHGLDPRTSLEDAAGLWLEAQEVKHALSARSKTTMVCFHEGLRMRVEITRNLFEDLTRDLVERTETTTSLVIKQAGLDWSGIDRVLLVGGSSRMPRIAEMLRSVTGKEPDRSQSPDEAVAQGAAIYAGLLLAQNGGGKRPAFQLVNDNSHSLGVVGIHAQTRQKQNVILIPKNTALPCRAARAFKTAREDQRSVVVEVVEGESHRPEECVQVGRCVIPELPAGLARGTPIEVEYAYAANGTLSVKARVPSVRYSRQVEIRRHEARNLETLDAWRSRLREEPSAGGPPPIPGASTGPLDRAAAMKRLDALYQAIGQAAVAIPLPPALARSQQNAHAATTAFHAAEAACHEAERARQAVMGAAEVMVADSRLGKAKAEWQQAQVRASFATLALGRDCLAAGICPPAVQSAVEEARRLRQQLG